MKITSNGRVRRTPEEWREILNRWKRSGMTEADFCRSEKIQLVSFQRWSRRLAEASTKGDFVELTTSSPEPSVWMLEIALSDGTTFRLQG